MDELNLGLDLAGIFAADPMFGGIGALGAAAAAAYAGRRRQNIRNRAAAAAHQTLGGIRRAAARVGQLDRLRRGPLIIHGQIRPGYADSCRAELKHFDDYLKDHLIPQVTTNSHCDPSHGGAGPPPVPGCLNAVVTGALSNNRVGRKIKIKSIEVEGEIYQAAASSIISAVANPQKQTTIYLALVLDTQTSGNFFTEANVYSHDAVAKDFPIREPFHTTRYRVLKLKRLMISPGVTMRTGALAADPIVHDSFATHRPFKLFQKLNIETTYQTGAGNVGDIVDNSLHLMAWCTSGNGNYISYRSRIRFTG